MSVTAKEMRRGQPYVHRLQALGPRVRVQAAYVVEQQRAPSKAQGQH
jgi:hypothetical protein